MKLKLLFILVFPRFRSVHRQVWPKKTPKKREKQFKFMTDTYAKLRELDWRKTKHSFTNLIVLISKGVKISIFSLSGWMSSNSRIALWFSCTESWFVLLRTALFECGLSAFKHNKNWTEASKHFTELQANVIRSWVKKRLILASFLAWFVRINSSSIEDV